MIINKKDEYIFDVKCTREELTAIRDAMKLVELPISVLHLPDQITESLEG